jgi:GT2 family glycosyltransferase
MTRPSVSVIVPFAGSSEDLERLRVGLSAIELRAGDQIVVADNRPGAPAAGGPAGGDGVVVCAADGWRSPGCARNLGARAAVGEWFVFIDADTVPSASLLDAYFEPRPADRTAILAGGIVDVAGSPTLAARHMAERRHLSQRTTLDRRGTPYAQTANVAVRASAFRAVGGFLEYIQAGEDADLCFRLAQAGWMLEERPEARVEHRTRDRVGALLRQLARHGSGAAWLNHRYPGEFPPPGPRELAGRTGRGLRDAATAAATGKPETAGRALLDLAGSAAFAAGRLCPNRARPNRARGRP